VNASANVTDTDLAFIAEACHDSLAGCASAWEVPSDAVVFYGTDEAGAIKNGMGQVARVATVVDDMPEAPGAEAYHTVKNGVVSEKILAGPGADVDTLSVGVDHENKEGLIDPNCDLEVTMPDGRLLAKEISDPVQGDVRKLNVTIDSVTRAVAVSNYVFPSYFDANGQAPYDAFGLVSRPFEIRPGGYQEITDPSTGKTDYVFGDEKAANVIAARRADPGSRLNRRADKRASCEAPTLP
jgi:hypothetical protein